ncbi:SDR family NAD(P)-dependent oxidoreductase [Hellea balneolensis]|uniref:SDR family NAD(P)-dependent oxidoreductase n=1 Tax=Hellea balneolensis TaxID=287478 RepID=UPI00040BE00D|nr:SDR family oxidoreductase [Hellea balneolensis]
MAGDPRSLDGKTVLITGGGSGVGLECARLFSEKGAKIFLVGRTEAKLKSTGHAYFAGDVRDSQTAIGAFKQAGKVDILINNAGAIHRGDARDTQDDDWQFVMDVNVNGPFYFSREFARQNMDGGAIINVSSTCGQVGAAGLAAYCASKGALDQLTRSMALELAPRKITVNAVAPGAINSPMLFSKHSDPKQAETVVERNEDSIPIGSVAEPQEVARAILFLAQERHITGTILSVDGGYTAV